MQNLRAANTPEIYVEPTFKDRTTGTTEPGKKSREWRRNSTENLENWLNHLTLGDRVEILTFDNEFICANYFEHDSRNLTVRSAWNAVNLTLENITHIRT